MSTAESKVTRLQREISDLERKIAETTTKAASNREKARKARDAAGRATNTSSSGSKLREAERADREAESHEKRRGELERQRANKTRELFSAQQQVAKENQEAQKKLVRQQEEGRRRIESDLARLQRDQAEAVRRVLPSPVRSALVAPKAPETEYDLFISHASEDKVEIAAPLAEKLTALGATVWYDEAVLTAGDSLRREIDKGLRLSRFGVVILSPAFFAKEWPQRELDGLVALQTDRGGKVVLPVWHRVTKDDVLRFSPTLADLVALNTAVLTTDAIAEKLMEAGARS